MHAHVLVMVGYEEEGGMRAHGIPSCSRSKLFMMQIVECVTHHAAQLNCISPDRVEPQHFPTRNPEALTLLVRKTKRRLQVCGAASFHIGLFRIAAGR